MERFLQHGSLRSSIFLLIHKKLSDPSIERSSVLNMLRVNNYHEQALKVKKDLLVEARVEQAERLETLIKHEFFTAPIGQRGELYDQMHNKLEYFIAAENRIADLEFQIMCGDPSKVPSVYAYKALTRKGDCVYKRVGKETWRELFVRLYPQHANLFNSKKGNKITDTKMTPKEVSDVKMTPVEKRKQDEDDRKMSFKEVSGDGVVNMLPKRIKYGSGITSMVKADKKMPEVVDLTMESDAESFDLNIDDLSDFDPKDLDAFDFSIEELDMLFTLA